MMHKIMMMLVIVLLSVGGYFGYQRYMNRQNNVEIQAKAMSSATPSKSNCYGICISSECNSSTGMCTIY